MASAWSMLWRGEEPQHHERFAVIVFTAQHMFLSLVLVLRQTEQNQVAASCNTSGFLLRRPDGGAPDTA